MYDRAQLAALAAVVDSGSFEAAARELHLTPSAVSGARILFKTTQRW